MRLLTPVIIFFLAAITVAFTLFGDGSYGDLARLRDTLAGQRRKNETLDEQVAGLKRDVTTLQTDDRALEKAARNELGMARPDELVFFFTDSREPETAGQRPHESNAGASGARER